MCACTEPVRTGIGAVCVGYGRRKWPITILNHRETSLVQKNDFNFNFWHPTLVRPARKRLFCLKAKNGLGRFAPSALPHYDYQKKVCGGGCQPASLVLSLLSVVFLFLICQFCCVSFVSRCIAHRSTYRGVYTIATRWGGTTAIEL